MSNYFYFLLFSLHLFVFTLSCRDTVDGIFCNTLVKCILRGCNFKKGQTGELNWTDCRLIRVEKNSVGPPDKKKK